MPAFWNAVFGTALLAFACVVFGASTYPSRPIRAIVGFVPGGATDIMARQLGQKLSESLGQPVIVDNRPGGSGIIAAVMELFRSMAKLDMVHIPYKGAAQATAETAAGHVQMTFSQPAVMLPHGRAGRVKVLGVTGPKPLPSWPEAFAAYIRSEISKWTRVVKEAGIRVE